MTLNGLWYTLVLVETILIYSRVDRNMTCKNLTSITKRIYNGSYMLF